MMERLDPSFDEAAAPIAADLGDDTSASEQPAAVNDHKLAPPSARYIDIADAAEGYENGPLLATYVAAFQDGRCMIVRDKARDPDVRKLLSELETKIGKRLTRDYCSMGEVAELRNIGLAGRRGQSDAGMQKTILDVVESAYELSASDIHIQVGNEIATVQFRIDGRIVQQEAWAADHGARFLAAAYAMADVANQTYSAALFLGARLAPRRGKDTWSFPAGLEAVRMQFNPVAFGSSCAVFRLLTVTKEAQSAENLGYEPEQLKTLLAFTHKEKGMAIFSGPTGSGKSTSMCAFLEHGREVDLSTGNERSRFTIEDPPERRLPGAQQLAVQNTKTEEERARAFAEAIRAAMRSDPQIIMIGEIRDDITANLAVGASITGHQVWTTLHCSSAHAIPMRLLDFGVDRTLIFGSDELAVTAAQTLVPLLCKHCRLTPEAALAAGRIDESDLQQFTAAYGADFYIACVRGCRHCDGRGVKGRTVLAEVIRTDPSYLEVLNTEGIVSARNFCRKRGEPSISDVGGRKVARGEVCALDTARIVDLHELIRLRAETVETQA